MNSSRFHGIVFTAAPRVVAPTPGATATIAPSIATLFFLGVYVLFALAVLDAVLLWRRTKKGILAKFGEDTDLKGLPMYAGMRSFQMRRTRMPKPQVERGAPLS